MTNPTLMPGQVVFPGPVGFAHNRFLPATATTYASATNSAQYISGAYPTKLSILAVPATTVTYVAGTLLGWVVVNAPNDATAAAWLSQAGAESVDVPYWPILMGMATEIGEDYSILRADVLPTIAGLPIFFGGN